MTKFIKNYYWVFIIFTGFVIDCLTKTLIITNLQPDQTINILPIFDLQLTLNSGSAFGFLQNAGGWQRIFFIASAFIIIITITAWQLRPATSKNKILMIALALITAGALGNTYDRLVYYQVIDFLHFYYKDFHYPAFNFADIAICFGVFLLMLS